MIIGGKYILSRALESLLTLFLLSLVIFVIARVVPGDPVRLALGPEATQEQIEAFRRELALDQPFPVQYYLFLTNLVRGKFGISFMTFRDCAGDVLARLPASLELTLVAVTMGFIGGVLLGVISALHRNKWVDQFTTVFAVTGVSAPRFLVGILLQVIVAYYLGIFPVAGRIGANVNPPMHITGLYLLDSLLTFNVLAFESSLRSIFLPAITLATSPLATIARLVRGNMIEEASKDYVLQATANGLPRTVVTYKYMLKNAITPALTTVGLAYVSMLGYSFVVETVFAWPGLASLGASAALNKDINVIVAVAMTMVTLFIVVNFLVDILYVYFDPRVAHRGGGK